MSPRGATTDRELAAVAIKAITELETRAADAEDYRGGETRRANVIARLQQIRQELERLDEDV